nr:immunoglobulin heavy chain junction region [Macaca mulatta]MOX68700.1 immunoglobulin heavy chain junction region [Macaca mulatta]
CARGSRRQPENW